jgi:tetratricopeptide (TPR) repeat protein
MYAMIYDNESNPVSGVEVFLNDKKIVNSDIQGRFILDGMKKGTYTIKLVKKGYEELVEIFDYEPLNVLYFKIINVSQLLSIAENLMDERNNLEAEKYIDRALLIEPKRQDSLFLKSINCYLLNKYAESLAILEELVKTGAADDSVTQLWELVKNGL